MAPLMAPEAMAAEKADSMVWSAMVPMGRGWC